MAAALSRTASGVSRAPPRARRPLRAPLGCQPRRRPMLGRPMFVKRDGRTQRARLLPASRVGGDALALVEDADQAGGAIHIDQLADQAKWRRIGHAIDPDMIIGAELVTLPATNHERLGRKPLQPGVLAPPRP